MIPNMSFNRFFFIVSLTLFFGTMCVAQEYVTDFSYGNIPAGELDDVKRSDEALTLPFFDDFSNTKTYPDRNKWQNKKVLVNHGFPKYPVNYQAATFDLLDEFGKVYSNGSSNPFIADSLMSVRIRLDSVMDNGIWRALTPADSVYFSFYYQPQGYGDAPETDDSLVLQFGYGVQDFYVDSMYIQISGGMLEAMGQDTIYPGDTVYHYNSPCNPELYAIANSVLVQNDMILMPCDTVFYERIKWKQVWSTPGMSLDTFMLQNNGNSFKQVMIPVTDEAFFSGSFYVLFFNYGTLPSTMYPNDRSNMDQWNVDYVYLDKNRGQKNRYYPKVGFSQYSPSLLKRYQAMPYRQYKNNFIAAVNNETRLYLSNTDSLAHQVQYRCNVQSVTDDWSYDYEMSPFVLQPYNSIGIDTVDAYLSNFVYDFESTADTTSFVIRHYIEVVDEYGNMVESDSLVRHQGFYNYYAYDDGIPEKGYGVVPEEACFAVQYKVSTPDTLCGVQMLFNRTFNNSNYEFFDIVVWGDNNGKPGTEMYRLENQRPQWSDSIIYRFGYFPFDKIVMVNNLFYVGIMQQNDRSINIGFDTSVDNSQYNFYDTGEGWKNSSFQGSVMIRPVLGKSYYIGVPENESKLDVLTVYPNPTDGTLHIGGVDASEAMAVKVFDVMGRELMMSRYSDMLNVDILNNGIYFIRIMMKDGSFRTSKFVISR